MYNLHLSAFKTENVVKTFGELLDDVEEFNKIDPSILEANFDRKFIPDLSTQYPNLREEDELYIKEIQASKEFSYWKDTSFIYYNHLNDWNKQTLISHWRTLDEMNDDMLELDFTISNEYCDYSDTLADQLIENAFDIQESNKTDVEKQAECKNLENEAFLLLKDIRFQLSNEKYILERIREYISIGIHHYDNH